MISITIKDIKQFMNHLLVKNTFDSYLVSEAVVVTGNTVNIDGQVNTSFYSDEELKTLSSCRYQTWESIRPFVFSLIKGNKVPNLLRVVFVLSEDLTSKLILTNNIEIDPDSVNGLFLNLRYQDDSLTLTTASSVKIFTLDKSLDQAFENYIRNYLEEFDIKYIEE